MAASSSSSSYLLDDPRFFVGRPDEMVETREVPLFQDIFRLDAYDSRGTMKRATAACKNCGCNVFELVFKVGCSIECALGFFESNPDTRDLIVNRFYLVKNYEHLDEAPKALPSPGVEVTRNDLLTRYINELYYPGDPRRSVYLKQVMENVVETSLQSRR